MLRHRKYKTPIWRKGTYEICCYSPERGYYKVKKWVKYEAGLIWKGEKADDEGGYYPCKVEYVRGEDGYMQRKLTRVKIVEGPPIILDEDWEIKLVEKYSASKES